MQGIKVQLDMNYIRKSRQDFEKHLKDMEELANKNVIKLKVENVNNQLNETRKGFEGINNQTRSFVDNMEYAIKRVAQFAMGISVVYGAIRELKSGLQEIAEINRANVNIAMITGDSLENVKKGNKGLLDLAENLKVVNSEVMNGNEAWMRSGVSIEEANKNLATTTKLSKIAGVANKDMADSLIVIKNAYDLNSKSLEGYASKVSLLDNQSATSSEKINSAMQYSAETFKSMGIDMDTALSWITNFSEKSAMGGEAIGRGFRSMLINFHKMQKGFKEGSEEETEAVNKLEALLNSKGIALRKNKDEWVDLATVIKNIQKNIDKFSDVEKSELGFRIGGKEQAELALSTLNNMKRIDELNQKLKQDSGAKALNESYEKYKQGIDAQLANLKNSATSFWMNVIDEKKVEGAIGSLISLIKTLEILSTTGKNSGLALVGLSASFLLLVKNANAVRNAFTRMSAMIELFTVIQRGVGTTAALSTAFGALGSTVKASLLAFVTNPVVLFGTAIAGATALIIKHVQHQKELKDQVDSLKTSYANLTEAMKENNVEGMKSNLVGIEKQQKSFQDLLKNQAEAKKLLDKAAERYNSSPTQGNENAMMKAQSAYNNITKKIQEQEKVMKDAGIVFNETTGKIEKLNEVESQLNNNKIVEDIKEQTNEAINHNNQIIASIEEYQKLNEVENKNSIQKERMAQLANELQGSIKDLVIAKDADGNVTIKNIDLLSKNIDMLNTENSTVETAAKVKMETAKQNAQWQINETKVTYEQILKRIAFYQEEMKALDSNQQRMNELDVKVKNGTASAKEREELDNLGRWAMMEGDRATTNLNIYQKAKEQIDSIYSSTSKVSDELKEGYTPANEDASKATKKNTATVNEAKNAVRDFENSLKSLNNTIYQLENNLSMMDDTSQSFRDGLKTEIELLKQKNNMLDQGISMNQNYAGSLGSITGSSNAMIKSGVLYGALSGYESAYYKYGQQYGVDPALAMAITMHETGNGSSYAVRKQNNPGGIMDWNNNWKTVKTFNSLEEGIQYQIKNLRDEYISKGLTSISQIGAKYAPSNAKNDPNGLNKDWIPGVSSFYNKITGGKSYSGSTSVQNVESEIDSLQSKQEDFEKQKIENTKKIQELYLQIYQSRLKSYDLDVSVADHKKTMTQALAEEWSNSKEYIDKAWSIGDAINEKYKALYEKNNYISTQINSGIYSGNQLQVLKKDLYSVQEEMANTSIELKKFFTYYYTQKYDYIMKPLKDDLESMKETLKYLGDMGDKSTVQQQYDLSKQISENTSSQLNEQKKYLTYLQNQLANEKYESTRIIIEAQIDKINAEILKTKEELVEVTKNAWEIKFKINAAEVSKITQILSTIESKIKVLNEDDLSYSSKKANFINEEINNTQSMIDLYVKQRDELINQRESLKDYPYLWNQINDKILEYQQNINNSTENLKQHYQELKQLDEDRLNNLEQVQSKVVNILKHNYELQKKYEIDAETGEKGRHTLVMKNLDDERKAFQEFVNEKLKEIDRENDSHNFNRGLKEKEDNLAKLQQQYNELAIDNSLEAVARRKDLADQIAKAQDELQEYQYQRGKELDKQNWQDILDNYNKGVEDKQKAEEENSKKIVDEINKRYDELLKNENLYKKASEAIEKDRLEYIEEISSEVNGVITQTLKTSSMSLQEALIKDAEQFGEAAGLLKEDIENGLIKSANKAIDTVKNLTSIILELKKISDMNFNINDNNSPTEANKPKKVYAYNNGDANGDYAIANEIYKKMGYEIIDTSKLSPEEMQKIAFGKNDIVLGNTLSNANLNNATRIQGKDRYETSLMARDYANNLQIQGMLPNNNNDKKVYVQHDNFTDDDYATAQKLLVSQGYKVVDVTSWTDDQKRQISIGSDDLVLGNALSNLNINSSQRIQGDGREDTYNKVQNYINTKINDISNNTGKIVDNTGKLVENKNTERHNVIALSEQNETAGRPSDYTSAKDILSPSGYNVIDARGKNHDFVFNTLKPGDVLISPELMSFSKEEIEAFKRKGIIVVNAESDRSIVRDKLKGLTSYGQIKGSYAEGGVVDYTGLAKVHGGTNNAEVMFNSSQASKLYNWVKNLPVSIPKLPISMPNLNIPSLDNLQLATQGMTLQVDNLIKVEGNLDEKVLPSIKDISQQVLNDIQKTFNKAGYFRR